MARYIGRQRKKRARHQKQRTKNAAVWAAVLVIFAASAVFFVSSYHNRTAEELKKVSYPRKYSEFVERAAKEYDLQPALIYAVIRTESGFNPDAESHVGARGVMQMMPSSFEWLMEQRGAAGEYTADDLFDPEVCIDYGCYLLKYFYDYYGTEQCAVAAYNAGFVVTDWLENEEYSADGITLDYIPYPETDDYVDKVESAKAMYIEIYYS